VTSHTAIDGWPVELSDTAGLRESSNELETAGVELAMDSIAKADLLILVGDASQPDLDYATNASVATRELQVRNKIDLTPDAPLDMGAINTSAVTGVGIELLLNRIAELLVPCPPHPGTAVPVTQSQQAALDRVQSALAVNDYSTALTLLQSMLAPLVHF
jgi:tRNA modification GTPase